MEEIERYKHLNKYLKEKFGERTLKICIDGGFTCPNRDGTKGINGCIFCSERGSGDHIKSANNIVVVKTVEQCANVASEVVTQMGLPFVLGVEMNNDERRELNRRILNETLDYIHSDEYLSASVRTSK